jgi:site-specific DNA-cytosine methylase
MANRVYKINWKSPTITTITWWKQKKIIDYNQQIRELTPVECERLQTVQDNYTSWVSNSQRYRMLGNGRTVDVITHIFSYLKKDELS